MKQLLTFLIFILVIAGFAGYLLYNYPLGKKEVIGSGNIVITERKVPEFNGVWLSGVGNLHLTQGEEEELKIEAEDNIINYLITEVDDETLKISMKSNAISGHRTIKPTKPINYYLTVKNIKNVGLSGSGVIKSIGPLTSDIFQISCSGSATVDVELDATTLDTNMSGSCQFNLRGNVENQKVVISGSSLYDAPYLQSKNTDIVLKGSGDVIINVEEELDVQLSGSGRISYIGSPKVNQQVSGSGSLQQL